MQLGGYFNAAGWLLECSRVVTSMQLGSYLNAAG